MAGIIISIRRDGPFANILIEHRADDRTIWTLYEHISGIRVKLFEPVSPEPPVARFMNEEELSRYGRQFDHFHFEVLKIKPVPLRPTPKHPERLHNAYTLVCKTQEELEHYCHDPMRFLRQISR